MSETNNKLNKINFALFISQLILILFFSLFIPSLSILLILFLFNSQNSQIGFPNFNYIIKNTNYLFHFPAIFLVLFYLKLFQSLIENLRLYLNVISIDLQLPLLYQNLDLFPQIIIYLKVTLLNKNQIIISENSL